LFDESFLRRLEQLALLSRRVISGRTQGERRSPKRGQSVEFADFRPYVPGDDFRRIDWNAYARLERFFVKLYVEEQDQTVHILVDTSQSMDWGEPNKLWYALRAAGALGYIALAGLDRVTAQAVGGVRGGQAPRFLAHRGKQHAAVFFRFLEALEAGGQAALGERLPRYASTVNLPGPVMLLSDLMDESWESGLRALGSRGFDVTVLHILAPDEVRPDLVGDLKLIDVETRQEMPVTVDHETVQRYQRRLEDWQSDLRRFCGARGMSYVPVETTLPLEELLFMGLRHSRVLT
jgi:uncharacterized protein (DUF58 family)